MVRVIALLRERNHCLEKFYWVNEQELINFGVGNFESVEGFYQARDQILDQINSIDAMINETSEKTFAIGAKLTGVSEEHRQEVELILSSRDELVKEILAQDLQVLTYIEKEKSNIIRELRSAGQAKRVVGAYSNAERLKILDSE